MASESEVWKAFTVAPNDPMMESLEEREALEFAAKFLGAAEGFGWSNSLALHKLAMTGFAQVDFGVNGSWMLPLDDGDYEKLASWSREVRHTKWAVDPTNGLDPYSSL